METILLTLEQLQEIRPLSKNLDLSKVDNWIFEAQINEMRDFLGGELFKLLLEDWNGSSFDSPRFEALFYGDDSGEEIFFGYWRALGLFSIAKIIKNNSFNVTRYSNSNLSAEIEEPAVITAQASKASQAESQALRYQEETRLFLEANRTDYPEFNYLEIQKKTSFNYIKVNPKRKSLKNGFYR